MGWRGKPSKSRILESYMVRICKTCKRAYVPIKSDPPNQVVCNSCRFGIPQPPKPKGK